PPERPAAALHAFSLRFCSKGFILIIVSTRWWESSMMKIYLTADKQLTHADAIEDGSWVCLTQPTPEEIRQVAGTLDIEPADLQAALDPEESARVSLEDGY